MTEALNTESADLQTLKESGLISGVRPWCASLCTVNTCELLDEVVPALALLHEDSSSWARKSTQKQSLYHVAQPLRTSTALIWCHLKDLVKIKPKVFLLPSNTGKRYLAESESEFLYLSRKRGHFFVTAAKGQHHTNLTEKPVRMVLEICASMQSHCPWIFIQRETCMESGVSTVFT